MGIPQTTTKDLFWNYYLTLVRELTTISDYIEFDPKNYSTYSIELAKLLMAASSEVDVILKEMCSKINPRKCRNIDDYKKIIVTHRIPDGTTKGGLLGDSFMREKVLVPRHGLELQPWTNWSGKSNPDWWKAYNNVKHGRNKYFEEATLKNTLNAIAALLVCIAYLKALEDMKVNRRNLDEAISWGWGSLTPRETFLRLDRVAYPLSILGS